MKVRSNSVYEEVDTEMPSMIETNGVGFIALPSKDVLAKKVTDSVTAFLSTKFSERYETALECAKETLRGEYDKVMAEMVMRHERAVAEKVALHGRAMADRDVQSKGMFATNVAARKKALEEQAVSHKREQEELVAAHKRELEGQAESHERALEEQANEFTRTVLKGMLAQRALEEQANEFTRALEEQIASLQRALEEQAVSHERALEEQAVSHKQELAQAKKDVTTFKAMYKTKENELIAQRDLAPKRQTTSYKPVAKRPKRG